MVDIVSKKLASVLNLEEDSESDLIGKNPLTNQPVYDSSLVTDADIEAYDKVEATIGMPAFSKIVLMKAAQKAMNDHDELIDIMAKVDDSKAARLAEVAQAALSNASDAAKALMNYSLQIDKMEIERQKLEIKSVTINNLNTGDAVLNGTQKEIMDRIKMMLSGDGIPNNDDDVPPLIDI